MERKIGEKFEFFPGVWLEVVAGALCDDCTIMPGPCGNTRYIRGECSAHGRRDKTSVIFRLCDPPAPEGDIADATLEFTATGTIIQDRVPPPSEWFKGLSDAWGAEILEAARDAFVYRFWDYPNTALALVMGVSEATVRRIRKKRLRKNKEEI